jgi:hypothetical protein
MKIPAVTAISWPSLWIGVALILMIEINALFGKMNPMITSVKAVIHSGVLLTIIFGLLVSYPKFLIDYPQFLLNLLS